MNWRDAQVLAADAEGATGGGGEPPVPVAVEGAGQPEPAPSPEPAPASEPPKVPQGLLDRLGQLTRQKRELEEQLALARASQVQQPQAPAGEAPQFDPEAFQRRVQEEASRLAHAQSWNEKATTIWNEGNGKFADWAPQMNVMAQMMGGMVPQGITEAAIASGAPTDVLYHLAKNPDEAVRIASLTPVQQAVAVAQIGAKLSAPPAPKAISNAPPPITPKVQGAGNVPASLDDPGLSMEEWVRLRNEQVKTVRRR